MGRSAYSTGGTASAERRGVQPVSDLHGHVQAEIGEHGGARHPWRHVATGTGRGHVRSSTAQPFHPRHASASRTSDPSINTVPPALPGGTQFAEEQADVVDERLRRLQRGEVTAVVELGPVHDGVALLGVPSNGDILGEHRDTGRRLRRRGPVLGVHTLVVNVRRRPRRAGSANTASRSSAARPGRRRPRAARRRASTP